MDSLTPQIYAEMPRMENLNNYRPGGFNPITVGSFLKSGRYRIANKIQYSDNVVAWLAEDVETKLARAILVSRAEMWEGDSSKGVKQLLHLMSEHGSQNGRENVLLPVDVFDSKSVNGTHLCVVLPLMGRSLCETTGRLLEQPTKPLPLSLACEAACGLVQGVTWIHQHGIVHADLHPNNLLLSLTAAVDCTASEATNLLGPPRTVSIKRLDGNPPDVHAPSSVVEVALTDNSSHLPVFGPLKIADFSESFFLNESPPILNDLGPYVLPEYCLREKVGFGVDIWQLGCVIHFLIFGEELFGKKDQGPEIICENMTKILGRPPKDILEAWRSHFDCDFISQAPAESCLRAKVHTVYESHKAICSHDGGRELSEEDIEEYTDMLKGMLVYEPTERFSAVEVLRHPGLLMLKSKV